MAIREILTDKDPALHKKCHPVTRFDAKLGLLLDDMKETLAHANGAGLAAPQIGILRRVVVVVDGSDQMLELVNPEILAEEGEQDGLEGCLSVPGYYGFVKRPMKVRVKAQDRTGTWFEAEGEEIVARCFCHETEHLDGHVFTEHADKLYTTEELDQLMEEEGKQKRKGR
ncbi:peptide deformylase [Candidatus Pseudoscillospira sp. SGI.172]|uniref:peptide deformylase n=1 Tax=Candidatus Pseudoscillospira sp. SGI.172 TaxID=3420582 RepID=UPI0009B9F712|nr:peptide deformylase [Pseudoflavonifractor sp.]MDY3018493.1 peptide deformylase [Oscillospiraceae bacterium]